MRGELRARLRRGAPWLAFAQLGRQALHLATWLLLARWLAPEGYGALALVLLVGTLAVTLADLGLAAAVVQRAQLSAAAIDTALWTTAGAGFALAVAVAAAAGPLAGFFGAAPAAAALRLSAASIALQALALVPAARLQRELRLRPLAAVELGAQLLWSGLALGLARAGCGVLALVAARVAVDAVSAASLLALLPVRPRLRLKARALRELSGFGGRVVALRGVNQLAGRLDALVIARLAGPAALGLYGMAGQVVRFPEQHLGLLAKRIAFPALARLQDRPDRFAEAYRLAVRALAWVAFPAAAGIALLQPELVAGVLGPAWRPTVPVVRLLAVGAPLYAIGSTLGALTWARGRPGIDLGLALFRLAVLGGLVAIGARHGALGVAAAVSAFALASFPVYLAVVRRVAGLSPARLLAALAPGAVVALLLAPAVAALRALLAAAGLGPFGRLAVCSAAAAIAVAFAFVATGDPLLRELGPGRGWRGVAGWWHSFGARSRRGGRARAQPRTA